jgi:hypothetical protein
MKCIYFIKESISFLVPELDTVSQLVISSVITSRSTAEL